MPFSFLQHKRMRLQKLKGKYNEVTWAAKREMYVQSLMGGCGSAHLLPELRRQRQEDHEFEVSMRYVMRILLGNGKEEKKDKKEM